MEHIVKGLITREYVLGVTGKILTTLLGNYIHLTQFVRLVFTADSDRNVCMIITIMDTSGAIPRKYYIRHSTRL